MSYQLWIQIVGVIIGQLLGTGILLAWIHFGIKRGWWPFK